MIFLLLLAKVRLPIVVGPKQASNHNIEDERQEGQVTRFKTVWFGNSKKVAQDDILRSRTSEEFSVYWR
jgi:hypothetical protein